MFVCPRVTVRPQIRLWYYGAVRVARRQSFFQFTQDEWAAFGISDLRPDHYRYIKADDSYFRPTVCKLEDVRSVWDDYFNPDGSDKIHGRGHTLVTTNKMQGPLSDQPDKIGEHAFATMDNIFYRDGSQAEALEEAGAKDAWRLSLLGHAWQPLEYPSREAALRHVLPSLARGAQRPRSSDCRHAAGSVRRFAPPRRARLSHASLHLRALCPLATRTVF